MKKIFALRAVSMVTMSFLAGCGWPKNGDELIEEAKSDVNSSWREFQWELKSGLCGWYKCNMHWYYWKNNKMQGLWTAYAQDWKLYKEVQIKDGKINWIYRQYRENWNVEKEAVIEDWSFDSIGNCVYSHWNWFYKEYYEDWKLKKEWTYKNWNAEWVWKYYDENWKLTEEETYKDWKSVEQN